VFDKASGIIVMPPDARRGPVEREPCVGATAYLDRRILHHVEDFPSQSSVLDVFSDFEEVLVQSDLDIAGSWGIKSGSREADELTPSSLCLKVAACGVYFA